MRGPRGAWHTALLIGCLFAAALPGGCEPGDRDHGPAPAFSLQQANGEGTRSSSEWTGRVLLINLWATWCRPCLEEIPEFVLLQKRYGARGLQVVGIALDEEEPVRTYLAAQKVNYPMLLAGREASRLAEELGNAEFLLPHSAIVNRAGHIVFLKRGRLHLDEAERRLEPLLLGAP